MMLFSHPVFAQTKDDTKDPFLKIDTAIKHLSVEISGSGKGAQCEFLSGNQFTQYYNRGMNSFSALGMEFNEMLFSSCYGKTVARIDRDIQRKILTPFATSGMACRKSSIIQGKIDTIMKLRWDLRPTVLDLPKNISAKYCKDDTRSESFQETGIMWKNLQKKMADLKQFFKEDKRTDAEKESDKKKEEKRAEARSKRIRQQAKNRVQSFVNDFIQQSFVAPLYAERSHINQNLRSLPNGKSRFVTAKSVPFSEMFTPPKNGKGESLWSAVFGDSVKQKATEIVEKKNYLSNSSATFNSFIATDELFQKKIRNFTAGISQQLKDQESAREYSQAYSEAIITSLKPFHATLQEAEGFLKEDTKLLEKTLNRQNIGVY